METLYLVSNCAKDNMVTKFEYMWKKAFTLGRQSRPDHLVNNSEKRYDVNMYDALPK